MSGDSGGNVAKSSSGSCPAGADATDREGAAGGLGEDGGGGVLASPTAVVVGADAAAPNPPPLLLLLLPGLLPAAALFFFFFDLLLLFEAASAVDCRRGWPYPQLLPRLAGKGDHADDVEGAEKHVVARRALV